jgi:hypothetical protein
MATAWSGVFAFGLQIYLDFSGYGHGDRHGEAARISGLLSCRRSYPEPPGDPLPMPVPAQRNVQIVAQPARTSTCKWCFVSTLKPKRITDLYSTNHIFLLETEPGLCQTPPHSVSVSVHRKVRGCVFIRSYRDIGIRFAGAFRVPVEACLHRQAAV